MFGSSYSNQAIEDAVYQVRYFDDNTETLLSAFPPDNDDEFILIHRDNGKIKLAFGFGVISAISNYYFDGKPKALDEFIKKVIIKSFNYGILANEGKNVYKTFKRPEYRNSEYFFQGSRWARNDFIFEVIENHFDISEYLNSTDHTNDEIEIDETFVPEEIESELSEEEVGVNAYKLNYENRYKKYMELWEFERELPRSKVFSDEFIKNRSKLDFKDIDFREIKNKPFKEALVDFKFGEDLGLIFEIFGFVYHLLKDQGVDARIGVRTPCDPTDGEDILSYPDYERQPFFGLKNKILSNDNCFSFSMVPHDFPRFGRSIILSNLSFKISIEYKDEEDEDWYSLLSMGFTLASKFSTEQILNSKTKNRNLYLAQELKSITTELNERYLSTGPDPKRLPDLIEDWKSEYYTYRKNDRDVYNHLMLHEKKYMNDDLIEDALHLFETEDFKIKSYAPGDLDWDYAFSIYTDLNDRRKDFMNEHGWLYDDFEMAQLKRFFELGVPIDPSKLQKGLGGMPISLLIALRMERFFAQLGDNSYNDNKFENLIYEIDEY
tara:strand:+ start:2460 stop:4109 length:1650 start_codon:yes stop_codon:yes gene_type:complete